VNANATSCRHAAPVCPPPPSAATVAAWLADTAATLRARGLEHAAGAIEAVSAMLAAVAAGADPAAAAEALEGAAFGAFVREAAESGQLAATAIVLALDAAATGDFEAAELRMRAERWLADVEAIEPDTAARWRRVLNLG
jgi:hypothetical protein